MNDRPGTLDSVEFSKVQLALLEKHFPNRVFPPTATEAQLRHYNGSMAVIEFIRSKTRNA